MMTVAGVVGNLAAAGFWTALAVVIIRAYVATNHQEQPHEDL